MEEVKKRVTEFSLEAHGESRSTVSTVSLDCHRLLNFATAAFT